MFGKRVENLSRAELELMEVFALVERLEAKIAKIEALASDAYFKAQLSHSLIVVRKIEEPMTTTFWLWISAEPMARLPAPSLLRRLA